MTIISKLTGMKKLQVTVAAAALLAAAPASFSQSTMIDGQVTKIDQGAGKITIKHGPLKRFGMDEAMTMVYRANNLAMLKDVKVGEKIKFMADRVNGQFAVTKIEKGR
jgi:Cu(I)/Ag(I) efflux system periplasmic protein CusF